MIRDVVLLRVLQTPKPSILFITTLKCSVTIWKGLRFPIVLLYFITVEEHCRYDYD